jgi:hypothetical protein
VNWTALAVVLVLAAGAAVVWLALAAKLVANEEKSKERLEAERRRLDLLREASEEERRLAAKLSAEIDGSARAGDKAEPDEPQEPEG